MSSSADANSPITSQPRPMPVDADVWKSDPDISVFVNAFYQFRDVRQLCSAGSRVLCIGAGIGLETLVLRHWGYQVTTFDIDDRFSPDVIGSVHDMAEFPKQSFDVVIASHVLEHLPVSFLDSAIVEIARVGRYAVIYLPVHGRHAQLRFQPGFKGIDLKLNLDVFNYLEQPDGMSPNYMGGHHFWELGMRGFRVADLEQRFCKAFTLMRSYRNHDWLPSYNFVLQSMYAGKQP